MATYKPRKLQELNSMYDKSLEAGRSIKQGSQIAEAESPSVSEVPVAEKETVVTPSQTVASATYEIDPNADISDIANDFILRFGTPERVAATTRLQENETIKAKVKPVSSGPAIKTAVATSKPKQTATPQGETPAPKEPKVRKVTSYRAELMEDYMKVMNDEDDDAPSFFKSRRTKKDKKKKHLKAEGETLQQEVQQTEPKTEVSAESSDTNAQAAPTETVSSETEADISFAEFSESIVETAFGEERTDTAEVATEQTETETQQQEEPPAQDTEEINHQEELAEEPEQEETADENASDEVFSSTDYEDIDIVSHSKPRKEPAEKKKVAVKRHILAKVLLSLLLVLCVTLAVGVGALKLVVGVDTGLTFAESYYVFTADKDCTIAGIKSGDLIIAENFPPEKGNTFVYVDTETQSFGFAKYSETVINEVSDVLITAETDDNRIAVFRDDIKGVVLKTVPQIGKFVAIACNYYILIISVLLALALAIVFILALAFKTKYEDDVVIEYSGEEEFDFDDDEDDDDDLSLFEEI